jgi:hypothetical protein
MNREQQKRHHFFLSINAFQLFNSSFVVKIKFFLNFNLNLLLFFVIEKYITDIFNFFWQRLNPLLIYLKAAEQKHKKNFFPFKEYSESKQASYSEATLRNTNASCLNGKLLID